MASNSPSSTAVPLYLIAFPDFGVLDVVLPDGSEDISFRNDTCPSFLVRRYADGTSLVLYVDYADVGQREVKSGERFILQLMHGSGDPGKVLLSTDDYADVLTEVGDGTPPLQRPDERLTVFDLGAGGTAWRLTEEDAPGLYALVYVLDGPVKSIASHPEVDHLLFALLDDDDGEALVMTELAGRSDFNTFYECHVGYSPDREPDGPLPIQELIANVAANMLLRLAEDSRV